MTGSAPASARHRRGRSWFANAHAAPRRSAVGPFTGEDAQLLHQHAQDAAQQVALSEYTLAAEYRPSPRSRTGSSFRDAGWPTANFSFTRNIGSNWAFSRRHHIQPDTTRNRNPAHRCHIGGVSVDPAASLRWPTETGRKRMLKARIVSGQQVLKAAVLWNLVELPSQTFPSMVSPGFHNLGGPPDQPCRQSSTRLRRPEHAEHLSGDTPWPNICTL